jgi:hypothetical protein
MAPALDDIIETLRLICLSCRFAFFNPFLQYSREAVGRKAESRSLDSAFQPGKMIAS